MTIQSTPRVTLAMPTYRQEKFVGEALDGLLAQNYPNLEILISDDASPDNTYTEILRKIENYSGPHHIVLNQNSSNLSINHFNKIMALSSGELVVIAHGDDISYENRVLKIVEEWQRVGASMITSNATIIDFSGKVLGQSFVDSLVPDNSLMGLAKSGWNKSIWGAVLAWTRDVFTIFGDIDCSKSALSTDWILPFRAAAINGIHYIDEPLVKIRQHQESKNSVYVTGNKNREINLESASSNQLIQRIYMLETLNQLEALGLQKRETIAEVRGVLVNAILQNAVHWRTLRNSLYNQKMRPAWEKIDEM